MTAFVPPVRDLHAAVWVSQEAASVADPAFSASPRVAEVIGRR